MAATRWLFLVLCVLSNGLIMTLDAHDDALIVETSQPEQANVAARNSRKIPSNDTGHAEICGPKNVTFEFSWTPKVVSQAGEVLLDINIIAPISFNNGTLSGDVYVPYVKSMIFEYNYPVHCGGKQSAVKIPCPLKKGKSYQLHGIPFKLKAMPVGQFVIHGKLKNEKGELFVCFSIKLEVKD